ncbi:hypothetical protein U1Q18_040531 [Sarracenia purpurea var. burkii]
MGGCEKESEGKRVEVDPFGGVKQGNSQTYCGRYVHQPVIRHRDPPHRCLVVDHPVLQPGPSAPPRSSAALACCPVPLLDNEDAKDAVEFDKPALKIPAQEKSPTPLPSGQGGENIQLVEEEGTALVETGAPSIAVIPEVHCVSISGVDTDVGDAHGTDKGSVADEAGLGRPPGLLK